MAAEREPQEKAQREQFEQNLIYEEFCIEIEAQHLKKELCSEMQKYNYVGSRKVFRCWYRRDAGGWIPLDEGTPPTFQIRRNYL